MGRPVTGQVAVRCQLCGTPNPASGEACLKCGNALLILSGPPDEAGAPAGDASRDAQEALQENLLERISGVEEGLRQLSGVVGAFAGRLGALEHELAVARAGLQALGTVLQTEGIVSAAEVAGGWERHLGQEILSRDLERRFDERSRRILSQAAHSGEATSQLRRGLRALRLALAGADTDAALRLLAEAARLAPRNDELWSLVGEVSFATGDLAAAEVAFQRVLALRGPHLETLVYLGTVASDLGHLDAARGHLEQARELAPESFLPLFALGALAVLREDHRAAVPLLSACLEREEVAEARYLLGVAHLALGREGRAIAALRRAVELQPTFEDALYQLGVAYLRRGWSRLALESFQQVLRLDPHRLQYQETVRLLRVSPRRGLPADAGQLVRRAERALEQDHPETALRLLGAASQSAPDQPDLQARCALLASALGRSREAISHARGLLRQRPQDSPYLAAAVVALLEALRQAGRLRAARQVAQRLYAEAQDHLARGLAAYELALVEAELGNDLDAARELAREALEITPRELRHYPLAALGAIAIKRGRFREATRHLEQATETAPRPPLLRQLAVARLGSGDSAGARAALEAADSQPAGGLDEELLGHVRRLGTLVEGLDRAARPSGRGRLGPDPRR